MPPIPPPPPQPPQAQQSFHPPQQPHTTQTLQPPQLSQPRHQQLLQAPQPTLLAIHRLLANGEKGIPDLRIRSVAFFMDTNTEKLGISFCVVDSRKHIAISPGLASLMNGSTSRTSMRRKKYEALPEMRCLDLSCRLVRLLNKVVVLIPWDEKTPFARASSILTALGKEETCTNNISRVISVDAMIVEHGRGTVADRYGCINASERHEVIVYEDRGENLSFLKAPVHGDAIDSWGHPIPQSDGMSGSERAQSKNAVRKANNSEERTAGSRRGILRGFVDAFSSAAQALSMKTPTIVSSGDSPRHTSLTDPQPSTARTRADKGQVDPPSLIPATEPVSHAMNAFFEFQAVTRATKLVNLAACQNILLAYQQKNESLLTVRLEEADAAIYDNDKGLVIRGKMSGTYMAAFSATGGFVAQDERETERQGILKFVTPPNDPIVVIARCTKIMLDDRILEMAKTVAGTMSGTARLPWSLPKITWVNGVPGCGKTTWVVRRFDADNDVIATTTTEAAKDLREKLAPQIGNQAKAKVRTMASILVNGFRESDKCNRLTVDEALMNHFGAIVMAATLSGAGEIVLIGDVNQLPYIDRENLFPLRYNRPNLVATISQELLCTHRNPMDVAYALSEVYSGIYSSKVSFVHSLELKRFTDAQIPKSQPNTLFLAHTQEEKETLINQGFGEGSGSRILTIHEAQGLTYDSVIIVQTKSKRLELHDSVPHAVVAVSRHTASCVYYTDDSDDAIGRFIVRAMRASRDRIVDYNLKMAMRYRDATVIEAMIDKNNVAE